MLDGDALNPGDLSWKTFEELAHLTVYERTSATQIIERAGAADLLLTNKTLFRVMSSAAAAHQVHLERRATECNYTCYVLVIDLFMPSHAVHRCYRSIKHDERRFPKISDIGIHASRYSEMIVFSHFGLTIADPYSSLSRPN